MVITMLLHLRIHSGLDVAGDTQLERRLGVHLCDLLLYVVRYVDHMADTARAKREQRFQFIVTRGPSDLAEVKGYSKPR